MRPAELPPLSEIQKRLPKLSAWERASVLALPLGSIGGFFLSAGEGHPLLALAFAIYLSFVTYGSSSHDLVHGNVGWSRRVSQHWLSLIELLLLRSGTVYRLCHLNHHARYPSYHDDPEGRSSYFSLWRALLEGPIFQARLARWAWAHAKTAERRWILAEGSGVAVLLLAGLLLRNRFPALAAYELLVILGSWIIPFITSYLVHTPGGASELSRTLVFRGWGYRILGLDHLYHLEHHLYPSVPHHRWKQLAQLLNPVLERYGAPVSRWPKGSDSRYEIN